MTTPALIHVVDDDESTLTALLRLLRANGFEAVGHGSAGDFLLRRPADRHGCILLDIHMPGPSGLQLQAALEENDIHLPIVFMTGRADVATSVAAMRAGAIDLLEKPIDPETLLDALRRAILRDSEERSRRQARRDLLALFETLSEREREVFELVVAGRLNKQIADVLGVSERTVKAQRASLMMKLGTNSAAELGRLAEQLRGIDEVPK
jgi:RNA polymerase sigma factor (sigma-70 family)